MSDRELRRYALLNWYLQWGSVAAGALLLVGLISFGVIR